MPKVEDLDAATTFDEQIAGLQVAVHDAFAVCGLQYSQNLVRNDQHFFPRKLAVVCPTSVERLA